VGQCVINMCSCALNHDAMSRFLCPIGVIISLGLAMSECSLSWRGQCHVSNFYIVDLENFATASRRYTGDIHNTSVVGSFMNL